MSSVFREAEVDASESVALRRRGSMADEVSTHLRELILTGRVRPGQRVDQHALSASLDVSRSPIREALVVLAQEGLVRLSPNRGAFVADISPADITEHYEVFGMISGRTAAFAAELLDDEQLDHLAEVHRSFESGDPTSMSRANTEFHRTINSVASRRTRWLIALLERAVPADYYEFSGHLYVEAVADHQAILDALAARDPAAARSAMETHLCNGGRAAIEVLDRQGFWKETNT